MEIYIFYNIKLTSHHSSGGHMFTYIQPTSVTVMSVGLMSPVIVVIRDIVNMISFAGGDFCALVI